MESKSLEGSWRTRRWCQGVIRVDEIKVYFGFFHMLALPSIAAVLLQFVDVLALTSIESTFPNCAYRLRRHEPPPSLAGEVHALSPRVCLGLARGEGWMPLITTEGMWLPSSTHSSTHFWASVLARVPLNSSAGRLFPEPQHTAAQPVERIAAFLNHATQLATGPAKICLVGDSLTRGIAMDLSLVRMHVNGLPSHERNQLLPRGFPAVRYMYTNFGLDGDGLRTGSHCHRLCKVRAVRANAWQRAISSVKCTLVIVEPAAAHHAANLLGGKPHAVFAMELREAISSRVKSGLFDLARHLDDVSAFKPLDQETANEVASVMSRHGDRVPPSYKRDVLTIADVLARWARGARGRTAIMRSPSPQMFPITGEFTRLTLRSGEYPLKEWTPFATARCGCQRLDPAIAGNTIYAQMERYLRSALSSNSSFAPVRYHDTYSALAYDYGLQYERSFIGCFNTGGTPGAAACTAGLNDEASRRFHDSLWRVPAPTRKEKGFIVDGSDDFCDCTHVGFCPYRLASMADGWLTAQSSSKLAAISGATSTSIVHPGRKSSTARTS